jgi:hypothetical protein
MSKIYELVIADEETDLISAISLVESPAIESDWIAFDKEQVMFASIDSEKKMLIGAILIPDKRILRVDGEGQPYHVFFSRETVSRLAQNYLMNKYTDSATLEHDKKIKGVHLVESWIKTGKLDKSNNFGLNIPEGSWVGIMKITDNNLWKDYVKTGKVKGFSIEGLFEHKLMQASAVSYLDKNVEELDEEEATMFLSMIKALVKKDKRYGKGQRIEMESYSDYPEAVKNNAKRALDYANKNGWGSCGTPVGKQRANQLAKGEPISVDTIRRIYSFISRHEGSLDVSKSYSDGCAKLMIDAWGGLAGGRWAKGKLRELGLLTETEAQPSITSSYPGQVASGSVAPALK